MSQQTNLMPAKGIRDKGVFSYPIRVYYEDTDVGGMVYHGKYVSFFERVRSESIRDTEADVTHLFELPESEGGPLTYVVRNINITYHRQATVGQALIGKCVITRVRAAAVEVKQWIENEAGDLVAEANVLAAVISPDGKPKRWSKGAKAFWQDYMDEYKAANAAEEE